MLVWLGLFAAIGVYAVRGVAWWPLVAVVVVSGNLIAPRQDSDRAEPLTMRRLNVLVAALVVLVSIALLPAWRPVDPRTGAPNGLLADAPPGLTAALRDVVAPGDRVLHPQRWGSWFEFAVPTALYTVDSRIELFPADVWMAFQATTNPNDLQKWLVEWGIDVTILDSDQVNLHHELRDSGWVVRMEDDDGTVWTHDE
jgi:hypothetical protein